MGPRRAVEVNRARWSTLVVALVVALVAAGCSSDPTSDGGAATSATPATLDVTAKDIVSSPATSARRSDATVLTADRGRVTVPDNALPTGVAGSDITAVVQSVESPKDGLAGVTFVLGPDGTRFNTPVKLEWDGPWAPNATYALSAFSGDRTPIADPMDSDRNSIAALRVAPTSSSRAHFSLPVDHFSVWSVSMSVSTRFTYVNFSASYQFDGNVAVGTPREVTIGTTGSTVFTDPLEYCHSGLIESVSGPVRASFPSGPAKCSKGETATLPLTLTCDTLGTGTVNLRLFVAFAVDFGDGSGAPWISFQTLRKLMLAAAWNLSATDGGAATVLSNVLGIEGGLFTTASTLDVNCVTTLPTTTTVAPTTTLAATTTAAPTTTQPGSPTTSAAASTTIASRATTTAAPTTAPSAPTTGAAPSTTTTLAATTTTAPLPTTTTTAATTTTRMPWGPTGAWAYNDLSGACNWNDSGGCGYYYGANVDVYIIGALGGPGSTWP